jgi:hypothetical protein
MVDYPLIIAYGQLMGHSDDKIEDEIRTATIRMLPSDTYYVGDGKTPRTLGVLYGHDSHYPLIQELLAKADELYPNDPALEGIHNILLSPNKV